MRFLFSPHDRDSFWNISGSNEEVDLGANRLGNLEPRKTSRHRDASDFAGAFSINRFGHDANGFIARRTDERTGINNKKSEPTALGRYPIAAAIEFSEDALGVNGVLVAAERNETYR